MVRSSRALGVCAIIAASAAFAAAAHAMPIIPNIDTIDIQFGSKSLSYQYNGNLPDTLTGSTALGGEVTALYVPWPAGDDQDPAALYYKKSSGSTVFGADLSLQFTLDAADVSPTGSIGLTGTGGGETDFLTITGSTTPGGTNIVLWSLNITNVSLYGYVDDDAYILEAMGTIAVCDSSLGVGKNIVGQLAVVRGHVDVSSGFAQGYTPADELTGGQTFYYSGETGRAWVAPEPASLSLLAIGGLAVIAKLRRTRRGTAQI
jgi:hypothetical protein